MLIASKVKLALACAAGLFGPLAVVPLVADLPARADRALGPALVEVAPGTMAYRVAGDFARAGKPVEAPLRRLAFTQPLAIMARQAAAADYEACVDDGACHAFGHAVTVAADRPAVQVSWHDAQAYAAWLSRTTGERYRLPTDEEWAFAAGSRFVDDGLPVDGRDPAKRWIARYERESAGDAAAETRAFGAFGVNESGLSDLGGNVWEWTSTCFVRRQLDDGGSTMRESTNCGVRVAEGAHRAYVTDFIRDARAGGCAAGVPPTNLGFRLVREPTSLLARLAARIGRRIGTANTSVKTFVKTFVKTSAKT